MDFQDLEFTEEKDRVKVVFLQQFYFYIWKKDLLIHSEIKGGKTPNCRNFTS